MQIWDALFPVAISGFSAQIDNIENPTEFNYLNESMNKQVTKGNDLMDDYAMFIKSQNLTSKDLGHLTAFWLSKNLQINLQENLKTKIGDKKFIDIISLFLKLSFKKDKANFRNYLDKTFKSDLKTKTGMIEYASLIELYSNNIFESIKGKNIIVYKKTLHNTV